MTRHGTPAWAQHFVAHLEELSKNDRGAMAALRHSLAFAPGDDPKAFPIIERFVGRDWHAQDARRLALYAVAGLFALQPAGQSQPLAAAFGRLRRDKDRPSLELRFVALLEADAESLLPHLRQVVNLLVSEGLAYDHASLLVDLGTLLNARANAEHRDDIRRRWARQFYRAQEPDDAEQEPSTTAAAAEA